MANAMPAYADVFMRTPNASSGSVVSRRPSVALLKGRARTSSWYGAMSTSITQS